VPRPARAVRVVRPAQRYPAETVVGRAPRLRFRQATPQAGFDFRVDMKPELVVDGAFETRATHDIQKTGPAAVPAFHPGTQVGLRIIEIADDSRCQSFCSRARWRAPARV